MATTQAMMARAESENENQKQLTKMTTPIERGTVTTATTARAAKQEKKKTESPTAVRYGDGTGYSQSGTRNKIEFARQRCSRIERTARCMIALLHTQDWLQVRYRNHI